MARKSPPEAPIVQVRRARELGVAVVIDTGAHRTDDLRFMPYGVDQARRGWLEKKDVLNARTLLAAAPVAGLAVSRGSAGRRFRRDSSGGVVDGFALHSGPVRG